MHLETEDVDVNGQGAKSYEQLMEKDPSSTTCQEG